MQPLTREGDQLVYRLSPDARLVIDASCCIVLATPERRITVSNVAAWHEGLTQAKTFQQIYLDDAEQAAAARLQGKSSQHG